MKWRVTWCGGSKLVRDFKVAYRLARSMSAKHHDRGGCHGANVWRERAPSPSKRGGGEAVVICERKVCRKTNWLQSR